VIADIFYYGGLTVAALGGSAGIAQLVRAPGERKRHRAELIRLGIDSAAVISDTAIEQVKFLREEIAHHRREAAERDTEYKRLLDAARAEIASLRAEVIRLTAVAT
jgi:hypothetical protein